MKVPTKTPSAESATDLTKPADVPRRTPLTHVPLSAAELPPLDLSQPSWPGKLEQVGQTSELSLHVRRTPGAADEVVVYVHGLGGSANNWTDLAGQLAPFASGIAVDLPGFGFSEPPPGFSFSLDAHAEILARYLAGLDIGAVHLVGNSMGGAVSLLLAAKRPELVRTLTLISPAVPDRRPDVRRLSDRRMVFAYLPVVGRFMRQKFAAETPLDRVKRVIQLCFADPSSFPSSRLDELVEEQIARADLSWALSALSRSTFGILGAWLARGAASLWAIAPLVSAPTLVVWGMQDRVITVRRAARTAKLIPRGRLLVLPRTGHVAQMERPTTVAKALLGMWEQVRAGRW